MREVETSSIITPPPQPQFSTMFQKLAMAVKTKTYEFFTEEDDDERRRTTLAVNSEGFSLLDSAEDFITDQKVVVLKPDKPLNSKTPSSSPPRSSVKPNLQLKLSQVRKLDTQMGLTLISSIFATISSFEASYLQLQSAHAPFVEEIVKSADKALVSNLQKLSDLKQFYRNCRLSLEFDDSGLAIGSCLESRVQENQSKLRALETVSNRLQAAMDSKDLQVWELKNKLGEIEKSNTKLSKRLTSSSSNDVVLSIRVYESLLHDVFKATQRFTKILIELMVKAKWDLELAANSVHPEVDYAKKGHHRYALLSYVCLGMFRGFDEEDKRNSLDDSSLRELMQHVSSNPMELLERDKDCEFSKFCEKKYRELIHPNMESSIFSNKMSSDDNHHHQTEAVLSSWRSLSTFYESFVSMASSVWTLSKLALCFDPAVEIFRVESGVDFSIVFMENVLKRRKQDKKKKTFSMNHGRAKVGFTVVPGFKIGCTVIQSRVYLTGFKM